MGVMQSCLGCVNAVPGIRGARNLGDMENHAQLQLAVGHPEQVTTSGAGSSATPDEASTFHTALEECLPSGQDGDRGRADSFVAHTSEYFSPRVEEMMRSRSDFPSDVEHQIEHSKSDWSEMTACSDSSEEDVEPKNRKVFDELMNDPRWKNKDRGDFFFECPAVLKVGQQIAEGGQATIHEFKNADGSVNPGLLWKVFKERSSLSRLRRQWPRGILRRDVSTCIVGAGTMLEDGRFAFMMVRGLADLRAVIDQAMTEKNNRGPPFPYEWKGRILDAYGIIWHIAFQMALLHELNIIHRDLKASNILLYASEGDVHPIVGDFECSIGVIGTGFFRAPEILLASKNNTAPNFTEKADVYSYGMTCFEVVTGRGPFEVELKLTSFSKVRDLVIDGRRPQLPSDLDLRLKDLIERCWNPIPSERPTFAEIFYDLWVKGGKPQLFSGSDGSDERLKDWAERFGNSIPGERPTFAGVFYDLA